MGVVSYYDSAYFIPSSSNADLSSFFLSLLSTHSILPPISKLRSHIFLTRGAPIYLVTRSAKQPSINDNNYDDVVSLSSCFRRCHVRGIDDHSRPECQYFPNAAATTSSTPNPRHQQCRTTTTDRAQVAIVSCSSAGWITATNRLGDSFYCRCGMFRVPVAGNRAMPT
jgi:hypothetical protein